VGRWVGPADDPRRYAFDGEGEGEPVGRGGEGFVYRGRRVIDGHPVAVKQLASVRPEDWPGQAARIRLLGAVSHPALGRHLDAFLGPCPFDAEPPSPDEFDVCYTVMAWVEGRDLGEAVEGATLAQVLGWVRDVAHATAALHRQPTPTGLGIVHRDIKPSNVRVDPRGGAVLIDFGIARPLDGTTMTRTAGAPGWMPPEAFDRAARVGARSDLWQVAGLAAWALLDTPPGALAAPDRRRRLEEALRRRGAPVARPLARHIDRALASRPADRPSDPRRWGDALVALGTARPRRRPAVAAVAAAMALALVLAVLAAVAAGRRIAGSEPSAGPPPAAPAPIGTVTVAPGSSAPLDFGEPVTVTVSYADAAAGPGRVIVEARSGDRPVGAPAAVEMAPPRQTVTLVMAGTDSGAPIVVDQLVVRTVTPAGAPQAEQRVPVLLTFAPALAPPERCTGYDPAAVTVVSTAPAGWRVVAGPTVLATMASRTDAELVVHVAAQADQHCLIGQPGGRLPPTEYWRRNGRLLGTPRAASVNAECFAYEPAEVRADERMVVAQRETLAVLDDPADVSQALNLARHYHGQCVVGLSERSAAPGQATVTYWQQ
jgi:hypothetical protein